MHVKTWQAQLEDRGLSASTVYGAISRLSSFYQWAMQDPELRERIRHNPATLARPKAPRAYQTDSVKALDDGEVRALLQVVRAKSQAGQLVGKRDYAMLLFYLLTGLRRAEVAGLRWGDLKLSVAVRPAGGAAGADGVLVVTCRVKGGTIENREVREPLVRDVLLDYLAGSGRLEGMEPETPLWTRHDLAGQPGARLTSHAFAKNLKAYAREAGIGDIHVHQTRHTFARIVAEESGSMTDTQDALGHT
jgi:integrase